MQVVLLESIPKLGRLGEVVRVKDGYARNYLFPQHKALKATKESLAYIKQQYDALVAKNMATKRDAESLHEGLEGKMYRILQQASDLGHLYGSVNARDVVELISETAKRRIDRKDVIMPKAIRTLGIFPVEIVLHPELSARIFLNVATSEGEAERQEKAWKNASLEASEDSSKISDDSPKVSDDSENIAPASNA